MPGSGSDILSGSFASLRLSIPSESMSIPTAGVLNAAVLAGTTTHRLSVSIDAATVEDLARGLHEATIRLEAGERWGNAADSGCWVRWTTNV
jgi:hypothetical protein